MNHTEKSPNLPERAVGSILNDLKAVFIPAVKKGVPMKLIPAVFLLGRPGVGKSALAYEVAEEIGKETGKKVIVTDLRLNLYTPVDLHGVPVPDAYRRFTEWLRPKVLDLKPSPEYIHILLLDEITAASPNVQAVAFQLTLERAVGEYRLPDNVIVMAAGNPAADYAMTARMLRPLANRMMHFNVVPDFESWRKWAIAHEIHPFVLGYLSYNNGKLYNQEGGSDDNAFATPRSWEFVSNLLKITELSPDQLFVQICGCIGIGDATEFVQWCKVYEELPDMEAIFRGSNEPLPRKPDALYALISAMLSYISEKVKKTKRDGSAALTRTMMDHCCTYVNRFPVDYATMFYRNVLEMEGAADILKMSSVFHSWWEKRGRVLQQGMGGKV